VRSGPRTARRNSHEWSCQVDTHGLVDGVQWAPLYDRRGVSGVATDLLALFLVLTALNELLRRLR
jgi:hypothetical protein